MAAVDEGALLTFLQRAEEQTGSGVLAAGYSGLQARIRRGDFTPEEETR